MEQDRYAAFLFIAAGFSVVVGSLVGLGIIYLPFGAVLMYLGYLKLKALKK